MAGAAALALVITPASSGAVPAAHASGKPDRSPISSTSSRSAAHEDLDVRQQGTTAATRHPGLTSLRAGLGSQGVVDLDPVTGTPRNVARLDGFLTGPSSRTPQAIGLGYVRRHAAAFGLDASDLATLRLRKDYVDVAGTHHLSFVQYAGSVPVFGNGLKVNVAQNGRLISVQGSPVHNLRLAASAPKLGAAAARSAAVRDVGGKVAAATRRVDGRTTLFAGGDRAQLVALHSASGTRLAWQTVTSSGTAGLFVHVVDATSGRVLVRRSLTDNDRADVWGYWPGRTYGGTQRTIGLTKRGWLPNHSPRLAGNNTHVYTDVNDDDIAQGTEEVRPGARTFRFRFRSFNSTDGKPCTKHLQCSWNPDVAGSWRVNRKQNAVQVFDYVNRMHDHLKARPIGFTRRAGNFEAIDDDAVQAQPDDGANTANGLPDSGHVDNANMGTPPDGSAPRMQMYLFHDPADPADPFLPSNGGDEADVVYHEYTHGLSNRLVVDPSGVSTLGSVQAGSMGEAWSDWYAMDLLNNQGLQKDTKKAGEVRVGGYVGIRRDLIRSQPVDCPVGSHSAACQGTPGAGRGGYTYRDFGKISGIGPEVHADGEIWGETLWDLRRSLGSRLTESLVTRAMELSPANPSFLDERNAILLASTVLGRGSARATIWKVFANRGMGYYAGSIDGDDTTPVADRHLPPAPGTPRGRVTGTVVDDGTSAPAPGVSVTFGGHTTGLPNSYAAVTGANGRYTIRGIYVGTYPRVSAAAGGFDREIKTVTVRKGTTTVNWSLRRDWAALSGGAAITASNGTEYTSYGCGPASMFDQSQDSGWSTDRTFTGGTVNGKFVTVELPASINVGEVAIDPSASCGDGGSASTGPYTLETSPDGTNWTTASSGTFTTADRGHFSSPALTAGSTAAVRFVRYTMLDSQVGPGDCPGAFSGCDFIDSTELEVYGTPAG